MASGGKPLRLSADRVYSRGSSQSLQRMANNEGEDGEKTCMVRSSQLLQSSSFGYISTAVRSSPNDALVNQLLYLAFGDHGVVEVEPGVLPLHRAVQVQGIAQPVVG